MAKVTSIPKAIAQHYGIRPGDDIDWVATGDVIRIIPAGRKMSPQDSGERLRLFDEATERHRRRTPGRKATRSQDRGWSREDLYGRGRSR